MLFSLFLLFVTGLLVGSVAFAVVPGTARAGFLLTPAVGVVGSVLGGVVLLLLVGTTGGLLGAVLGVTALVWFGQLRRQRAAS